MLTALNRPNELESHVRGALNNGLRKADIQEVLLRAMIYCGVPAGVESFRIAQEVFKRRGFDFHQRSSAAGAYWFCRHRQHGLADGAATPWGRLPSAGCQQERKRVRSFVTTKQLVWRGSGPRPST